MKTRILAAIGVFCLALVFLLRTPFGTDVKKEVAADVYTNGVVSERTTIRISGVSYRWLLSNRQEYIGYFYIDYYERTCREDMQAGIRWAGDYGMQSIHYNQNATYPSLDLDFNLLIDKSMNEFALRFSDGTIIATSKDWHDSYINFGK